VASVQRYVDSVLNHASVQRRWPGLTPIRVRPRGGVTAAHYERRDGERRDGERRDGERRDGERRDDAAVIAVPAQRDRWALRELVVLHEIAHHICDAPPPHGPEFVATFTELAGLVMGPEVEHVLRVVYLREGVQT
jgi:putative metallohydrolase (TIGR04338 family)